MGDVSVLLTEHSYTVLHALLTVTQCQPQRLQHTNPRRELTFHGRQTGKTFGVGEANRRETFVENDEIPFFESFGVNCLNAHCCIG
jgi:hypothetical protein